MPDGGATSGNNRTNVTKIGKQAMHDWLDEGGKVFATHFHYTWFKNGPPDFQGVANWLGSSVGSAMCDCSIDTPFRRGSALRLASRSRRAGGQQDCPEQRCIERIVGELPYVAMDL